MVLMMLLAMFPSVVSEGYSEAEIYAFIFPPFFFWLPLLATSARLSVYSLRWVGGGGWDGGGG